MSEQAEIKSALKRCVSGDTAAYELVVSAFKDKAYHFALMILNNHHDSMDLAQDAFVKAFRSLDQYDTGKPFLPWFFRILRNLCLNELQKRARRAENNSAYNSDELLQLIPAKVDDPQLSIVKQEQAVMIRAAMLKLPAEQKEVVFLRHFEDLSYEEIADILAVPTGTVMSRLFNGRKKLAEIIKKRN